MSAWLFIAVAMPIRSNCLSETRLSRPSYELGAGWSFHPSQSCDPLSRRRNEYLRSGAPTQGRLRACTRGHQKSTGYPAGQRQDLL